jgi:hypothetical protein
MAREPKIVTISGKDYTLLPTMRSRKAAELDMKMLKAAIPLLSVFKELTGSMMRVSAGIALSNTEGMSPEESLALANKAVGAMPMADIFARMDAEMITRCFQEALGSMAPHEFDIFLQDMLAHTQTHIEGKGYSTLSSAMLIDLAFDKPLDMYKLIVEVARYNSFTPFEFLAGGSATPATAG